MLFGNSAQIDITPTLGTLINGEFTSRYARKIADRLFAKAIYLNDRNTAMLLIMVDICVMKRDFLDPIKKQIHQLTGIAPAQQLIASTHAHSTGSVADLLMGHVDVAYRHFLEKQLLELAKQVVQQEHALKVAFGKVSKPEHLTCRRYKMDDTYQPQNPVLKTVDAIKTNPFGAEEHIVQRTTVPDPEVCFVGFKDLDNRWVGLLANYNLHYVGDCERGTITADYFGYFARKITGLIAAPDMVCMMSNGTSGEVNIWDFIEGDRYPKGYHAKSELIGEDLAKAVFENLDSLVWDEDASLGIAYEELSLNKRAISPSLLAEAVKLVGLTNYEAVSYTDADLYDKVYAREQVLLTDVPEEIQFPVQCFRIGSIRIGGLGGEFFSASGKALKAASDSYFTICMANDYVGYVPPKEEFENGGYETWRCRSSFLAENSEEKVRDCLMEMIRKSN